MKDLTYSSYEEKTGYQTQKNLKSFKEILQEGIAYLKADDLATAEKRFNFLLNLKHDSLDALFFLIAIELKKKNIQKGKILIEHLLRMDEAERRKTGGHPLTTESLASTYNNLGYIYTNSQQRDLAKENFLKSINLVDTEPDVWSNLASLYINEGMPDKAIEYADKALALNPDSDFPKWNKSLALLEKGEYGEGFDLYEAGFKTNDRIDRNFKKEPTPFWSGEKGKTIVVYGEQGMGDEIMFSSILPDLAKDNNIIFECHPRLANIFRNSFDFPIFGTRKAKAITWSSVYDFDSKLSIATLGKYFRRKKKDFPKHSGYLKADKDLVEMYKEKLDKLSDKPKIGISWKGGTPMTASRERSIPLYQWKEIFDCDATFISLQYTPEADVDANKWGLTHWQEAIDDYDHTAALVSNLDLVISVCTSVIHLSGALSIPCWVLTPNKPAWRYKVDGDMDWYPSVKLYRQKNSWAHVIKQVKGDLCKLLQKNTESKMSNCI